MLQYAVPSAPTSFAKATPVFADSLTRPASTAPASEASPSTSAPQGSNPGNENLSIKSLGDYKSSRLEDYSSGSQSPALSALASLAANAPIATTTSPRETRVESPAPTIANRSSMNQSQYAPAATAGGTQNGPPVCQNCGTSTTPLWRRDEAGSVLCNACGLFLKLHNRARPISLKTDVIKSRNRVKTSQTKKRDSQGEHIAPAPTGYPAAHPQVAHAESHQHHHHVAAGDHPPHLPSPGSLSRSNTPGLAAHNTGIAPQHIFDSVSINTDSFPTIPAFPLRQPSPSGSSLNGNATGSVDGPQGYEATTQVNQLRTRVSELEVINDLFRGRVSELESSEQEARRSERAKDEEAQRLTNDLNTAKAKLAELERKFAELQDQLQAPPVQETEQDHEESPSRKRPRTDNVESV